MFLIIVSLKDLMFIETSASTGENVAESFLRCARVILSKIESGLIERFVQEISRDDRLF